MKWPQEGEAYQVGDIGDISENPRVQKALKRLAAEKAATTVAQLVMWNVAAGLDWETIAKPVAELGQSLRAGPGPGFRGPPRLGFGRGG